MSMPAMYALAGFVLLGVVAWGVSLQVARRVPDLPVALIALAGIVLAYGWAMTLNGHPSPVLGDRLFARGYLVKWLPGAVDRHVAFDAMVPLTAVLLAGLALLDLCRSRIVRVRLLVVIASSAALMSLVATVDRATSWSWPFDAPSDATGGTRFVSFGYHGNAAAYLELALPAALVLAARALGAGSSRQSRRSVRSGGAVLLSCALAAAVLVGSAVNVSKLGQVLAGVIVVAFGAIALRDRRGDRRRSGTVVAALAVLAAVVVLTVGAFAARDRWQELPEGIGADSGRVRVWQVAGHAWTRSPVFGSGPGGFKVLLPDVAARHVRELYPHWIVRIYHDGDPVMIWSHVHEDPLQTLVEWGPFAGAGLAVIVLWPLVAAVESTRRARDGSLVPAGAVIALTVVYAHSLVDFPLQVFAIQLTVAAWAAIALATSRDRALSEESSPVTLSRPGDQGRIGR
jgi:O-antigen ligase